MRADWDRLAPRVDAERHRQVAAYLRIQEAEARWWRDASIAYFQSLSRRPLPAGVSPPPRGLDHYRAIDNRYAPGQ